MSMATIYLYKKLGVGIVPIGFLVFFLENLATMSQEQHEMMDCSRRGTQLHAVKKNGSE
jgi:hypothetical protein